MVAGHNWGAEHDPDTDSCSPSSLFNSGKYLMYAYSVSGYDANNNVSWPLFFTFCMYVHMIYKVIRSLEVSK